MAGDETSLPHQNMASLDQDVVDCSYIDLWEKKLPTIETRS